MSISSPDLRQSARRARAIARDRRRQLDGWRARRAGAELFDCPLCGTTAPFLDVDGVHPRFRAICAACGAAERHRMAALVLDRLRDRVDYRTCDVLHFAPEPEISRRIAPWFRRYETSTFDGVGATHAEDLTRLSRPDESYDIVIAIHVLEHIEDDATALREIRRILRPGGFALLPVPIVADASYEYRPPFDAEFGHVRAPGPDYFERFTPIFSSVEVFGSDDFDQRHQPWVEEDRTTFPSADAPQRRTMHEQRFRDLVPVAWR